MKISGSFVWVDLKGLFCWSALPALLAQAWGTVITANSHILKAVEACKAQPHFEKQLQA